MKNLSVSLMEYLEDADFAPEGSGDQNFLAIRSDILEDYKLLPALIFAAISDDFDAQVGSSKENLFISIVGKSDNADLTELSKQVKTYIEAMQGQDIKGILITNVVCANLPQTNPDVKNGQIEYLHQYEITWR